MTKFLTYYNLCPIPDPKEFLGTAADCDQGNVITTLGKNIVMIIKTSNQKQIRSWSVLEKLSAKVVYDRRSQKYVGVFAGRALRCWDESTRDINKCKKLKFQKGIADLVNNGEDTLVLYNDGTFELLAAAIQSRKEEITTSSQQLELGSSHTLSDATVSQLNDGRQILTYFERDNKTGSIELVRLPLQQGDGATLRFKLKREIVNVQVAGHAVIEGDDAPLLLTIWSDKRIFLQSLHDDANPDKSPGNFVSMISALKVDSPLSVLGIARHFVAIYGANSGQEGGSLLLYNTQFKVIKAKQFFKVYFNFSRLWAVDEHILLAVGQNLSVVSYNMSKEVLAELVGTQTSNDFKASVEGDHINEEETLQESLKLATPISGIPNDDSDDYVVVTSSLDQAADGKFIPFEAVNEFDRTLGAISKLQMHVEVVEVERALEDAHITLMSNFNDKELGTREVQLIARQLERCGASEHEITEKLLTVLIKANLLQDIALCLRRYSNVSEKMLAKTLSHVLGQLPETAATNGQPEEMQVETEEAHASNDDNLLNGISNDGAEFPNVDLLAPSHRSDSAVDSPIDVLNVVLACSFDPASIAVHIRREIDYPKVLLILEHLYHLLSSDSVTTMPLEERPNAATHAPDFEMQLLRWFGVFLNTHFQKLALSKDTRLITLLFKWHELFVLYRREIVELEEVAALLYNVVQNKKIFKEKNYSKWYSIEEVVLF